ncbi:cytochrome P450 [Crocosphaera sp. UHCC 0190]|uniref:cytochrome P450 n=1 Tax=Crocosphaera sp. UHCC 0190 TaxID=3110246 RepID=UPI002B206D0D|nr:cytochrome P450 [Crocosphaera sp. UHCC 0190]MEA5511202.1 cytochrome P450 [Crocosphaera sp. UHCC 0190]
MIRSSKIPAAANAPTLIEVIKWIADPVNYMEKAMQLHGDIFRVKMSFDMDEIIFVNHPEAVQQILTHDRQEFSAPGDINKSLSMLFGDASVLMINGDRHKKRRQLLMPPFHGERMQSYGELIIKLAHKVMEEISPGSLFIARKAMQSISLQVIIEAVFGFPEGEKQQKLEKLLIDWLEIFKSPLTTSVVFFPILQWDLGAWSPWGKFLRTRQALDDLLYNEIAERRANPDPSRTDILSLLMSATDEQGNQLSDQELRDELLTLLFAGHETTATAMTWALYWTHYHPEISEKVRKEIATLGKNPNLMEFIKLPYLTAVCQESLRIYPVAMLTLGRKVEQPVELMGYQLEPGQIVAGCMYLIHQREDIYPDHDQFKPERFLEKQFSPYEFIPFGGGSRRCIGDALAQFEMKLVLATILANYDLSLVTSRPEKPKRRGITLAPETGVKMLMKGKKNLDVGSSLPKFVSKV